LINEPKTLDEARKIRYGCWAGNPNGVPYREGYCAKTVAETGRAIRFYQCQRKAVIGIWCRQHSPDAVEAREQASAERFRRQMDNHPVVRAARYREALEKIANRLAETPARDVAYMREIAREALK
jgi:hypothetical protein